MKFNEALVLEWAKAQIVAINSAASEVFDMDAATLQVHEGYADRDDIVVCDLVLPINFGEDGLYFDVDQSVLAVSSVINAIMDRVTGNDESETVVDDMTWLIGDGDDTSAARWCADGLHVWVRHLNNE